MSKLKDMTNQKFGRLLVLKQSENRIMVELHGIVNVNVVNKFLLEETLYEEVKQNLVVVY